ncbi:hypothetical protein [Nocardia ninae]|uniref:hypothetical protein n=1 Tax=Nocardia ninae TaxID=356145 RepID=UPI0011BF10E4|nr:hypothetical protein [Nocardia ninae]
MDAIRDIINFGIARAISERRPIDVITARLIAVELDRVRTQGSAVSDFVHDGRIVDAMEDELLRLDFRTCQNADDLQRWACWLSAYVASLRRPSADGDAFCAFLSLQPAPAPHGLHRRFAGVYLGSFASEAELYANVSNDPELQRHDVAPLFGRYHLFVR